VTRVAHLSVIAGVDRNLVRYQPSLQLLDAVTEARVRSARRLSEPDDELPDVAGWQRVGRVAERRSDARLNDGFAGVRDTGRTQDDTS
jgi:hypothetical protein